MSQIEFRVFQTLATEHQVLLFWFMEHQEKSVLTGWSGGSTHQIFLDCWTSSVLLQVMILFNNPYKNKLMDSLIKKRRWISISYSRMK